LSTCDLETISEVLDHQADTLGDETCLACDRSELSYAALRERSLRLAAGLRQLGLKQGDRLAVLSENSLAFLESFFACLRLGLIDVPLNVYLRGEFLRHQLAESDCVAAIVDGPGFEAISALDPPVPLTHIILTDAGDGSTPGALSFDELIAVEPLENAPVLTSSDIATIVYTSGTTGMPKGCMIPHGMYTRLFHIYRDAGYVAAGDRMLTPSPMFHNGFLAGMMAPSLCLGASIWTMRRFQASTFMQTAREIGATAIYSVGSIGHLLLAQPPSHEDTDPGRMRLAVFVPMPPARQLEFEARFGVPVVGESYGQTECMPITGAGVGESRARGSAGKPTPAFEVAVVDADDNPLPPDQVGEIVVRPRRPDMMFTGFWNNPEATLETWRNLWHHTGDLGRQSADGTLWIVDRKKDFIRRRGENVSSLEVEAAIEKHPAIQQVAIHAVPSDMGEDEIKCCIVAGSKLKPTEMFDFFKRELPYFAIPRYVELMKELPTGAAGRPNKQALRDRGITEQTWDFEKLGLVVSREERRGKAELSAAHRPETHPRDPRQYERGQDIPIDVEE